MNCIQNMQNKLRTFVLGLLPVSVKDSLLAKLKKMSISDNKINHAITATISVSGLFLYKMLYTYPRVLSIMFSVYPIHITIAYTKANRPLPIEQRKILMTWFYLVLWDNMTFIISNYPLVRIAGYVTIVMKKYEDTQWTVGYYVIEKHGHVINKIKKYAPETEGYSFFNQEEPVRTNDMDSSQHILSQGPIKTD